MNKLFFQKLKKNVLSYLLEFFCFQEKIFLIQINKKFKQILQQSNNLTYFQNIRKSLIQYSFPQLLSNDSYKIEEFLSLELQKNYLIDDFSWNQLLEFVLFFLSKKFIRNFNDFKNFGNIKENFDNNLNTLLDYKKEPKFICFPSEKELRAQFYLKKTIKASDINNIVLRIENNIINKKSGKCLAKILNNNKIETLFIDNCQITHLGLLEFNNFLEEKQEELLYSKHESSLRRLEIQFCYLKDFIIAKILSNLVSKNFHSIEILNLSCNNVGKETISVLSENLKDIRIKKLKINKSIHLDYKVSQQLCKYIQENPHLTHLSLLSCDISERVFGNLSNMFNSKIICLESLGITIKNFSQEIYKKFEKAILSYRKLKTLKVTICNFSVYGLKCLSRMLSDIDCNLYKFELNKADFKFSFSKDFPIFLNSLLINTSLESLNLTECYFSEEQKNDIFNFVLVKKIQKFKLSRFKFSLNQDLLVKLKFAKKLSFVENDFDLKDLKELILSVKNNNLQNAEVIDLSYNPFLFPDFFPEELIFGIIENCRNLKKIHLKNNFINHKEQLKLKSLCQTVNRDITINFQ